VFFEERAVVFHACRAQADVWYADFFCVGKTGLHERIADAFAAGLRIEVDMHVCAGMFVFGDVQAQLTAESKQCDEPKHAPEPFAEKRARVCQKGERADGNNAEKHGTFEMAFAKCCHDIPDNLTFFFRDPDVLGFFSKEVFGQQKAE